MMIRCASCPVTPGADDSSRAGDGILPADGGIPLTAEGSPVAAQTALAAHIPAPAPDGTPRTAGGSALH